MTCPPRTNWGSIVTPGHGSPPFGERCLALRTEKEEMLAGDLYDPADADLQAEIEANHRWLVRYNAGLGTPVSQRRTLLLDRLAAVGEGAVMRPPFHCDYGFNISL